MSSTDLIPRLCSVAEAASLLCMPIATARRRARSGSLPVVGKLAGQTGAYILDLDEVESLAAQRKASK